MLSHLILPNTQEVEKAGTFTFFQMGTEVKEEHTERRGHNTVGSASSAWPPWGGCLTSEASASKSVKWGDW